MVRVRVRISVWIRVFEIVDHCNPIPHCINGITTPVDYWLQREGTADKMEDNFALRYHMFAMSIHAIYIYIIMSGL